MAIDFAALTAGVTVSDGGWATELRARGFDPRLPAESANIKTPTLVRNLAQEYVAAGARFLTTNTFAISRLLTGTSKERNAAEQMLIEGAKIAREAAADRAFVAGAIGPSGKILSVRETTEEALEANVSLQARRLAEAGVDCIVLETFSELAEILAALRAAQSAKLPVIACMSFDSGAQHTQTIMGASADECGAALHAAGAGAIGCNCGAGVAAALPAVVALRAATNRPLWVKPSAGLPDLEDGRAVYHHSPEEFVAAALKLVEAGANVIGGCCGTGPEHIRRLSVQIAGRARTRATAR